MTIPPFVLRADDFRSYRLPESLTGSISPVEQPGEPGLHWLARGLMYETSQQLLARPIALELTEHEHIIFVSAVVSLASTVLSTDPLGDLASVDLVLIKRSLRWALIFSNRLIATDRIVPPPRYLADLVGAAYDARRAPQTETCRGPVTPPSHLW